jgi:cytochrome c2
MKGLWHNVQSTRFVVLLSLAITLLLSSPISAQDGAAALDGKKLFKTNCASCHYASDKKGTGPGLKGVLGRIPDGNWKYRWVRNSQEVIKSGDAYANKIFKEYNNSVMTNFGSLSDAEIDAILTYADKGETPPPPPGGAVVPVGNEAKQEPVNNTFLLIIVLVLLIILIAVLRFAKINLKNAVNEKEGRPDEPALPFVDAARKWMNENKRTVAVIALFLVGGLVVNGWYVLKDVGVYAHEEKPGEWKGYKPSQPINFSHKIHAGDNGIDCKYCHSTVEKSKTASIPSANVCMNCHKVISETANPGSKEEIAKIYEAVGFDPAANAYTKPQKPIRWNKVHVLPDHVYFSHQQHVVVGKQECETCHGNVKEMTVAEQQRPLTMGWCINCHRETNVAMEDNGYYTELHAKMKEKYKGQPITVSMVGGIECARCHY